MRNVRPNAGLLLGCLAGSVLALGLMVWYVNRSLSERRAVFMFMTALRSDDVTTARRLLDGGLDPNTRTLTSAGKASIGKQFQALSHGWHGVPLLTSAVYFRAHGIQHLLLARGAAVNTRDDKGNTALTWAASRADPVSIKLLIARGADVNGADRAGTMPLMWAAVSAHADCARLLLDRGAAVNAANKYGETALIYAIGYHHLDTARLLISRGADVNKASLYGTTPLMCATTNGYPDIVRLLLTRGARADMADRRGFTALSFASVTRHPDIAAILKKAGAHR
ncbi:MAG TPA: ankyrin repeat domain-containing protein [Chthonomonadaceae bacterium]|nr:ankyrin repeat domain-containing protein [Chthonomonadaceae bacterium]